MNADKSFETSCLKLSHVKSRVIYNSDSSLRLCVEADREICSLTDQTI